MSKLDDLVNMYKRLFPHIPEEEIKEKVMRNARIGVDPVLSSAVLDMHPTDLHPGDTVMERLKDLQASYGKALEAELEMPISTLEKNQTIQTAMSAPTMNLSLISDRQVRNALNDQWQELTMGGLNENVGFPSVLIPSGNVRSQSVLYNMPDSNHPLSVLMSGRAVSVSNEKVGEKAMSVSSSAIPTVEYLQTMISRRDPQEVVQQAIDNGRRLRIMTSDIETGGVGPYDLARSVFGQTYEMPTDTATDVAGALKGISQSTSPSDTFNFHMLLPEMQTLTRGQRRGLPAVQLGGRLADIESGRLLPGGGMSSGAGRIFDLTTKQGRIDSAAELTKYLQSIADPDTMLLGNNFVSFDIPRLLATASAIPEFMENPEARGIIEAVQKKAASDSVIDVTQMSRQYLSGIVRDRMASLVMTPETIIERGLTSLLSPESLAKAGIVGEGVKPFSIENVVTSTNVLEQMYDFTDSAGNTPMRQAVLDLAGGSHISELDAQLSMSIYRGIVSGDLDIQNPSKRADLSTTRGQSIASALDAVSRATATVPTSNIASMGEISDQVFDFLTDPSGASDRTLIGARVKIIDSATGQVEGFLHYNPEISAYEKVFSDPRRAPQRMSSAKDARNVIRRAMSETEIKTAKDGSTYTEYGPNVISTGINVAEASQMNSTLAAVSRFSGLSTIARGPGAFLSTEADEDAFVAAMTTTRKHIGFPHLSDRPESVTSGPRKLVNNMLYRFEMPNAASMATAQDLIYQGGAGLAVLDPVMRSNFVAISTLTSAVPYQGDMSEMAKEIAKKAEAQRAVAEGRIMTDAQIEALVSTMPQAQIDSINLRATDSSLYLSEQTVSHVPVIKKTRLISAQTMQPTKPLISRSVLSEMRITEGGKSVPMVDSAFWKKAGLDTSTLSIVKTPTRDIVNLVAGKGGMARDDAGTFAESLLDVLKAKTSLTVEEMVEQGLSYSLEEAGQIKALLANNTPEVVQRLRQFSEGLAQRLMESGPAIGAIEGEEARGITAVLQKAGSDIGNDQPAIARGMVFQTQRMGEETISFSGSIPQAARDQLSHMGGAESAAVNSELSGSLMQEHLQALGKAESSDTFMGKLKNIFHKDRVDAGVFGTKFGRNRTGRDAAILDGLAKIKPKLALGTIAVGAASAGYYLAKKQRLNKMYDQTMQQQPYEDQGMIQQANSSIQQDNQQTSARRDPLVTAGVVGNLDRNKIGHTGMGPNKYNHLYGG
jgi:hypothetical protein